MRFMMMVIPPGYEKAAPGTMPEAKAVAAMMKYNESLQKAGGVAHARRTASPPSAGAQVLVLGRETPRCRRTLCRGPRSSSVAYWMIQVKSKEEAVEWAKRCPANDGDIIEVRQVHEMSEFPPDVQKAAEGFQQLQGTSRS